MRVRSSTALPIVSRPGQRLFRHLVGGYTDEEAPSSVKSVEGDGLRLRLGNQRTDGDVVDRSVDRFDRFETLHQSRIRFGIALDPDNAPRPERSIAVCFLSKMRTDMHDEFDRAGPSKVLPREIPRLAENRSAKPRRNTPA